MIEIQTIEHIRTRPGMYIGDVNEAGFYQMLQYLFTEICDNHHYPFTIECVFERQGWISISIKKADTSRLEKWIQNPMLGGGESRGIGAFSIIALSREIRMIVQLPQKKWIITARSGVFQQELIAEPGKPGDVHIRFLPDDSIFKGLVFNFDVMILLFRRFTFLTPLCTLVCSDKRRSIEECKILQFPLGVANELDYQIGILDEGGHVPLFKKHLTITLGRYHYQISFAIMQWYANPGLYTFANYQVLYHGGALQNGVINGITRGFNYCMSAAGSSNRIKKSELKSRILLVAVVKNENFDFVFKGSLRGELYSPEIQQAVSKFVFEALKKEIHANPELEKLFRNKYF